MAVEDLSEEERFVLMKSMHTHMLKAATELMGADEIANIFGLEDHDRYICVAIYAIQHVLEADGIDTGLTGGEGK